MIGLEARALSRSFRTFDRRPGLSGALRDLLRLGGEERVALAGIDLRIEPGERVALIGPNGAGKSTTIKLACGILAPSSGEIRVGGLDPHQDRRRHVQQIGVVFGQRTQLWWDLAVQEAYDLLAAIYRVPAADYAARRARAVEILGLEALLARPVRELSLGQRMRCDIGAALLHGPSLLILDEPTIGLDVAVKHRIREMLLEESAVRGATLLLTTHDLRDVEAVCERVILLHQGRILFDGSVAALTAALGGRRRLVMELDRVAPPAVQAALVAGLAAAAAWEAGDRLSLRFARAEISAPRLISLVSDRAAEAGLGVAELSVEEPAIEEVVARFYEPAGGPQ